MKYTKLCLTGLTGFLLGSSAYYGVDTLTTERPIQEHSSGYVEESKEIEVVEVIKEVPVVKEIVKEVPTIKEVPVEIIKVQQVPVEVEKIVEIPKVEYITEYVPVEVIKEVEVEKPIEVIKEVEVPVEKIVEVEKEVFVEVPKIEYVEVIKEIEVPVEIIKEVEVPVVEYVKADNNKMGAYYMAMAYRRTGMDDTTIRQTLSLKDKFNQDDIKWAFSQLN